MSAVDRYKALESNKLVGRLDLVAPIELIEPTGLSYDGLVTIGVKQTTES